MRVDGQQLDDVMGDVAFMPGHIPLDRKDVPKPPSLGAPHVAKLDWFEEWVDFIENLADEFIPEPVQPPHLSHRGRRRVGIGPPPMVVVPAGGPTRPVLAGKRRITAHVDELHLDQVDQSRFRLRIVGSIDMQSGGNV